MRIALAAALFAAVAALVPVVEPAARAAQDKKDVKKGDKTAPPAEPPKASRPDEATLKAIAARTAELRKAVAALAEKKVPADVLAEVEIYLKAAENVVRFEEWQAADGVRWVQQTLDRGLARAKQAEGAKAVWRAAPGAWVVRAYRSAIDGSIQPYAVLLPAEFGKDASKKWRLDVVLHGRDATLTEAKFIATHNGPAPKGLDHVQLAVYGRGNNAYRWAGETDVFEARDDFARTSEAVDPNRVVLRGFSMGGAGTWQIGLHHPSQFCVLGPGAGFTTTRGYVADLPADLPAYVSRCLHIYDAVDYAENVFDVPVVAYSGEKDRQKQAADNIEAALKGFKEPYQFTHLVAPGLDHQMPKEWQDKAEAEYKKYADKGRAPPGRVHFVTYTPRYGACDGVAIHLLEETYARAAIDVVPGDRTLVVKTTNVKRFDLRFHPRAAAATSVAIDGDTIRRPRGFEETVFEKRPEGWTAVSLPSLAANAIIPEKRAGLQGPIDDAFLSTFRVVKPTAEGFSPAADKYAAAAVTQFAGVWDRYFRGALPLATFEKELVPITRPNPPTDFQLPGVGLPAVLFPRGLPGYELPEAPRPIPGQPFSRTNLVLFGDPRSNPMLGKISDKLPITWTPHELVVNGVKYDVRTHVPVLIYPNPLSRTSTSYVVINAGHTFKESDLKGTNALLYPRLGDWAVIKPTPTAADPAAFEVVAAGLFDENWQFVKKK
jgi:hypothetical protein